MSSWRGNDLNRISLQIGTYLKWDSISRSGSAPSRMTKYMNKILIFLLSLLILHFALLTSVDAHILKTDGSIGGIIHIDPEDDPIAGELSNIFWDLTNNGQKFNIDDCICYVSILENGKEIEKERLMNETFTYTFPKKDVYQILVSGSPKGKSSFAPFNLSYDIRVERVSDKQPETIITNPNTVSKRVIIGAIITALGTILVLLPGKPKISN
jgi:hypothetical protein